MTNSLIQKTIFALVCVCSVPTLFAAPMQPPPDPLPMVQMAQAITQGTKQWCSERYPEMAGALETAYRSWPLSKTKVVILVNGKEYESPFMKVFLAQMREDFFKEAPEKNRVGCVKATEMWNSFLRGVPPDVLAPFLDKNEKP